MIDAAYLRPRTLAEVHDLRQRHGDVARLVGGGTVVALLLRQRLLDCTALVSLAHVAELAGIAEEDRGLRLGALCTYRDLAHSEAVRRVAPSLAETATVVATPRIRNQGTLGGCLALADPHFDLPVTLLALDAEVVIASPRATRTMPVERLAVDYYENALEPDELVAAVLVPRAHPRSGVAFTKFLVGSLDDYAAADVAVRVRLDEAGRIDDARVVLGSLGPRVFRAGAAEDALRGEAPSERSLSGAGEAAAAACDPDADQRGSREYKRDLVRTLVPRVAREALRRATGPAGAAPRIQMYIRRSHP